MLFESGRDDVLIMFFYRGVDTGLEFLLVYRGLQCVRGVPARMYHWTVDPGAPVSEHCHAIIPLAVHHPRDPSSLQTSP